MPFSRKLLLMLLPALMFILAACAAGQEDDFATPLSNQTEVHEEGQHDHAGEDEFTTDMQAILVPSELVLGPNRFAVGLMDPQGALIDDATVHFHYYDLSDRENPFVESEANARKITSPDSLTTIYAHDRDFVRTGLYGLEIEARRADGSILKQRIGFEVADDTETIGPGEKAPLVNTATLSDVGGDARLLTSAANPDPALHQISLAQALNNDQPTLLLLATPSFCQTRFCGPAYELVSEIAPAYEERLNFVYAEVFSGLPDPASNGFAPSRVMTDFGLESEPWVFLIDEEGTVVYRLEGLFTVEEIEQQLRTRLGL